MLVVMPQIFVGLLERVGTTNLPFDVSLLTQTVDNKQQFCARINLILDSIFGE